MLKRIMKKLLLAGITVLFFASCKNKNREYFLIVGTYNSATSEGIYVCSFNSKDGTWKPLSHVKTSNPSFLTVSPDEKFIYAVNEDADSIGNLVTGHVSSFRFDKPTATLSFLNQQPSAGKHPCYITIDKTGKWVMAGNYNGGNFSVFPVKRDGSLEAATQIIQHEGSGPDSSRQLSPHVHGLFPDKENTQLHVTDLGIDKIMHYDFDAATGNVKASAIPFTKTQPGGGPRHLAISSDRQFVYLLLEMTGSVMVFNNEPDGKLTEVQTISSLPDGFKGDIGSADIHLSPDGKFLYASNRGTSNDIAIFHVNKKTGVLTLAGHQSALGTGPRNFNFDPTGNFLLVANQKSDEIVVFKRNKKTGLLTDTGERIAIGKPVCIQWIKE